MAKIAIVRRRIVSDCGRNVDIPLQRFPVQQQILVVSPATVSSWQPLMLPKHNEVFVVAIRAISVLLDDSSLVF